MRITITVSDWQLEQLMDGLSWKLEKAEGMAPETREQLVKLRARVRGELTKAHRHTWQKARAAAKRRSEESFK